MKKVTFIVILTVSTFLFKCSPTDPSIGSPPGTPTFTYAATSNPNYIAFTATSTDCFLFNWDFGNGTSSIKRVDTAYYPFPDTYSVSLTVSNKGGAATTKDTLVVLTLDSTIAKNVNYRLLTGGIDSVNGKTWVWHSGDSAMSKGAYINGITDPLDMSWWQSVVAELDPLALDDEYVFTLKNYKYENKCMGFFMYNYLWMKELLGIVMGKYKDTSVAYAPPSPSSWTLSEIDTLITIDTVINDTLVSDTILDDTLLVLHLSNTNYIGLCAGTSTYQIMNLEEDTMLIRYPLFEPDEGEYESWYYLRLVTKK